jgi:exopolysaccharide production protein ExoQ
MRLSVSLLVTLASVVIIADRLTPSQFLGAYWIAMMVVVLGSAPSNHYTDTEGGPGLAGLTGSKNALGYYAALGATAGLSLLLDRPQPVYLRWAAAATVPISLWVLWRTKSAGGLVAAGLGLAIIGGLTLLHALSPRGRILALLAAVVIAIPVAINFHAVVDTAQNFQEDVLKKDRTLTGRTYLWDRAEPIIRTRPILGMGYSAFWRQGQLDAEGLWRHAGISNRSGFNFHNEYVDTAVTLGWTGVVILAVTLIGLCLPVFVRALIAPTIPIVFFAGNIAPLLLKTTAETGLLSYWSVNTTLLYAGAVYARRRLDPPPARIDSETEPR